MNDHDQLVWIPPNRVVTQVSILAEKLDYAHQMLNIPYMWKETRGAGVKVCVIDTGIPDHLDISVAGGSSVIPNYSFDKNGHATHVGGIIAAIANNNIGVAGIAPEVDDYYIAALNEEGAGSITDISSAILCAVDEFGVDIINMSLGIPDGYAPSSNLESACDYAVSRGVTVIAAAGNEDSGVGQPACYDSVIAVAAVDSELQRAWFSNQGPEIDFATPGVNIYSTYLHNRYAKLNGTSMACPMLAGIAALIIADARDAEEILSPDDVRTKLRKIAFDIGADGVDQSFGNGMPIFGNCKSGTPEIQPPFVEPTEPQGKAKSMPTLDCVYWRMFGDFVEAVGAGLDSGLSMEMAMGAGFRKLRAHKTGINILLKQ